MIVEVGKTYRMADVVGRTFTVLELEEHPTRRAQLRARIQEPDDEPRWVNRWRLEQTAEPIDRKPIVIRRRTEGR